MNSYHLHKRRKTKSFSLTKISKINEEIPTYSTEVFHKMVKIFRQN